jgi:hypothetical protein
MTTRSNRRQSTATPKATRVCRSGTKAIRVPDIMREYGQSKDYWYAAIARGDLPAMRLPGAGDRAAAILVLRADLDRFLAGCRIDGTGAAGDQR